MQSDHGSPLPCLYGPGSLSDAIVLDAQCRGMSCSSADLNGTTQPLLVNAPLGADAPNWNSPSQDPTASARCSQGNFQCFRRQYRTSDPALDIMYDKEISIRVSRWCGRNPWMNSDVPGTPVDVRHKLPPLPALTSVRFFAALYVVLYHLNFSGRLIRLPVVAHFFASGYLGVTFFFVLSGFILAYNYPAVKEAKQFWIARFARIYPVYILSILLFVLGPTVRASDHFLLSFGLSLGLLQAFWPPLFQAINPVAWTLSVEMFFYALFPALLPWVTRVRWQTFLLIQVVYGAFLCVPMFVGFYHGPLAISIALLLTSSLPIFKLNMFVVGVYLALLWRPRRENGTNASGGKDVNRWALWLGAGGSVTLLCLSPTLPLIPARSALLTWTFGALIFALAASNSRVLTSRWLQIAGEISYSFYLLQSVVFLPCFKIQRHFVPRIDPWNSWWSLLYVPLLTGVSYLAFIWIEIPARLIIRRVLSGRPVPTRSS